ncbi:ABC transporter permease [Candidatus Poribacteria bacterium]|nr:ABC transporter permease [Candidatus Poribacteria bacterium]
MIFDLIPTTIRMSTPLILTALGGIYSERSGVVNIALEGMMLMGTFGYVMGTQVSASTWLGLTIGMSFGAAIAAITFRADQIVSGVAINLLAVSVTEFLGRNATSQRVEGMTLIGGYSFIVYLTPLLVVMSEIFLFRTPYGLRLCAAGESTNVLHGLGLSRKRWQYFGVLVSGIFAAVGGCFLASEAHYFTKSNDSRTRIYRFSRGDFW